MRNRGTKDKACYDPDFKPPEPALAVADVYPHCPVLTVFRLKRYGIIISECYSTSKRVTVWTEERR